ncbi:hypothetical protein H7I53_10375 [Mycolicibacterium pulveris]|uniref:Uncharacterized protein n=1 Tax=Mycolicibacterium pulveris TaxID=36813 RepID=A0A7I7UN42_MYCPV|nr:hypothetical protein [Mycolicibacterium pulveris]MCV6980625.1 hypothetical protein [Mycolicibacterium pulveris]BBY82029.1 hypothetical protein MPUL_31870 [Mycolicibacterium pulveris]
MRSVIRCAAALFAGTAAIASVAMAPTAAAAPRCVDVGPNTTQCQTNGSAQIVTSPTVTDEIWGWPYGGFVIAIGGFGW